jgi:hypothetical protein
MEEKRRKMMSGQGKKQTVRAKKQTTPRTHPKDKLRSTTKTEGLEKYGMWQPLGCLS